MVPRSEERRDRRVGTGSAFLGLLLLAGCGSAPTGNNQTLPDASNLATISRLEQLALERINRARLLPAAEATRFGIAIDEGIPGQLDTAPRQPVALNEQLNQAARSHSSDMLNRDYFAHDTLEGVTPFQRMSQAGYAWVTAGENLAWRGTTGTLDEATAVEAQHADLFVDSGIAGRGHRVTMLVAGFREVGIAVVRGVYRYQGTDFDALMQTQDYAASASGTSFVLGVVYNDSNRNGSYDCGEGVGDSGVTLASVSKRTNAGGGYAFDVPQAGTHVLRFEAGPMQSLTIATGAPNIKVDLVDGQTIVINLGVGPLP